MSAGEERTLSPELTAQIAAVDSMLSDEPRRRSTLVFYFGDECRTVDLAPEQILIVGRTDPSDVIIADASLSRQHARFSATEMGVWVEDLGSTNKTRVNGEEIVLTRVSPDDEVRLGDVRAFLHVIGPRHHHRLGVETHDRFAAALEDEVVRARTFGRALSLMMIRSTGSVKLDSLNAAIRERLRPVDRIGSYAPQIVEVMLPELDEVRASSVAEAMLEACATHALVAGIVGFGGQIASAEEMIDAAREAVMRATATKPVAQASGRERAVERPLVVNRRMRALLDQLAKVARSTLPVLIVGETGTGKEVLARRLHEESPCAAGPLRSVNCGAIAQTLLESTLFGFEKGAFTGADRRTPGLFEQASGGTIFLDEIAELPASAQPALLRVLETKTLSRLGGTEEVSVDVRVIAATHQDLDARAEKGLFRRDLLFRLNTVTLEIPPLRERRDEIGPLALLFIEEAARQGESAPKEIEPEAMALLEAHDWPGNVRELKGVIFRAAVLAEGSAIRVSDLSERITARPAQEEPDLSVHLSDESGIDFNTRVRRFETELILRALAQTRWNQSEAAKLLKIPQRTLTRKMAVYELRKGRG